MRHLLISAAKGLAEGKEPPAVGGGLDFRSIRGAEKILEPGEDWRMLWHQRRPGRPGGLRGTAESGAADLTELYEDQ